MNFVPRKAAAAITSAFVPPVFVAGVGLSQKEKAQAEAQQAAWRSPPSLANAKKLAACCPPAMMGMGENIPTNGLLNFLGGKDATNDVPIAALGLARPSTCHAFHQGTGLLSTIGENGLTNGLCCIGDGMESQGKHVSMGIESHGKHVSMGIESAGKSLESAGTKFGMALVAAFVANSIGLIAAAIISSKK
jgi:hypothetical protein